MNTTSRVFAFLAYLLSIIGVLFVVTFRRKDDFALYHAKQSLGIGLLAVGALILWFLIFWMLVWIPYIGPILGFAVFALVIAAYIILTIACVTGMVYAFKGVQGLVPLVGETAFKISSRIFMHNGPN